MAESTWPPPAPGLFSSEALDRVIKDTLPQLPPGKTSAVVGMVDLHGVKIVAVLELKPGHVEVQAAFTQEWDGDRAAGAKIIASW